VDLSLFVLFDHGPGALALDGFPKLVASSPITTSSPSSTVRFAK
jgi:hypothetical protein